MCCMLLCVRACVAAWELVPPHIHAHAHARTHIYIHVHEICMLVCVYASTCVRFGACMHVSLWCHCDGCARTTNLDARARTSRAHTHDQHRANTHWCVHAHMHAHTRDHTHTHTHTHAYMYKLQDLLCVNGCVLVMLQKRMLHVLCV